LILRGRLSLKSTFSVGIISLSIPLKTTLKPKTFYLFRTRSRRSRYLY